MIKLIDILNESSNTGERIQNLNNRIKVLRDKISATKSPEQKNKFQNTLKNALQSLSNIKKDHSIKAPHRESIVKEGLYHVGYNKGRGQGTGVFKDSYSSYKDAKKAVEKLEKQRGGSYNMIAYYVADKDGKFVRESVNEVGKLVYRINKSAVEAFIKKYPKVKEVMKAIISKNKDVKKGYKAFINFVNKNESYLGGRPERTDSKNFGSKVFYKYDWNGVGGWAEVYEYLYDTQNESVNEGNWSKIMAGVRKGSQSGPWTIVVIKNKKVVHQKDVKFRDTIPAHYEDIKKQFKGATLGIEDGSGQMVYTEKI